jgi:hypothetical protein
MELECPIKMIEPRAGRPGYTGPGGSWYTQRQGTTGDEKTRRVQFSVSFHREL